MTLRISNFEDFLYDRSVDYTKDPLRFKTGNISDVLESTRGRVGSESSVLFERRNYGY